MLRRGTGGWRCGCVMGQAVRVRGGCCWQVAVVRAGGQTYVLAGVPCLGTQTRRSLAATCAEPRLTLAATCPLVIGCRVAGYTTDVVEFVSTDHTPRNLLIRAELPQQQRQQQQQQQQAASGADTSVAQITRETAGAAPLPQPYRKAQLDAAREYLALRDYWGVLPRLEVRGRAGEQGGRCGVAEDSSEAEWAACGEGRKWVR